MANIVEVYTGSNNSWGTEFSLTNGSTSLGSQTLPGEFELWVDFSNLADGDSYEVRIYEKVRSSDTQRVAMLAPISNNQSEEPHFVFPRILLMDGWEMSLKRTGGSDRTIAWSVRKIVRSSAYEKNVGINDYVFIMTDDTLHQGMTGIVDASFTKEVKIDGGPFTPLSGTITEIDNGVYAIDLSAAELNGKVVTLRFAALGADDTVLTIVTED